MKPVPNRNHYNLNPPEPVFIETYNNPVEDYYDEIIAEHNEETRYDEQHIILFDYIETEILNELIKNEPKQSV